MNQREAKRQVCGEAALIIKNALENNIHGEMTDLDGPDEGRLAQAWSDLLAELKLRGSL